MGFTSNITNRIDAKKYLFSVLLLAVNSPGLFRVGGFVVPRNVLVRLNDLTVFPFQKYP